MVVDHISSEIGYQSSSINLQSSTTLSSKFNNIITQKDLEREEEVVEEDPLNAYPWVVEYRFLKYFKKKKN